MASDVEDQGASKLEAVTKSDTAELRGVRALWVGGAGDVAVLAEGDATDAQPKAGGGVAVLIAGVPAGTLLPIKVRKVMSTSTTATAIVAMK